MQPHIKIRNSDRTVPLALHSPKYSNRRITKKTAQLQSDHDVQPESSHPVDSSTNPAYSSARACDISARFKTISKQFSKNLVTQ